MRRIVLWEYSHMYVPILCRVSQERSGIRSYWRSERRRP